MAKNNQVCTENKEEAVAKQEYEARIKQYGDFVTEHAIEIAQKTDELLYERRPELRELVQDLIIGSIDDEMIHYEKYWDDWCTWDCSGEIRPNGHIDLNLTIEDFLENELTGARMATFTSGCGWNYLTYGDDIEDDIRDWSYNVMRDAIQESIEKEFDVSMPDKELDNVFYTIDDAIEEISEESEVNEFFWWNHAVDVVGIGNVKLKDILFE